MRVSGLVAVPIDMSDFEFHSKAHSLHEACCYSVKSCMGG